MSICRVLLVENDEFFRKILRKVLERRQYEVHECADGRQAREILKASPFDLIISDIEMPFLTGVELLEWTRQHYPVPVILITGFSNLLDMKSAYELGAAGFLTKPFTEQVFFDELEKINFANKPEEKREKDLEPAKPLPEEYCKVLIDDFISGSKINFSIYIKMSDTKYVKVAHSGEDVSLPRIKKYREKGLKYLYISKDDYRQLVGLNKKLTKAISDKNIDPAVKLKFFKYSGEIIAQSLFIFDLDKDSFTDSKEFVQNSLEVIADDTAAMQMLEILNSHADFLYAHALGVSVYAVMIAKKHEWQAPQTIFKIAMGGLFHDIGKKEISREILEKPRALMTATERKIYESHTVRGKDILKQLTALPSGVKEVAEQHHENRIGTGFPLGLRKHAIFPLAALIAVANKFCELVVKSPHSPGMSAKEALKQMQQDSEGEFAPEYITALQKLVIDPSAPANS